MEGNSLNLQIQEATPTQIPQGPTPTPQIKQKSPYIFEGDGFISDETDSAPISISASTDLIDYGPLSPTNPILRQLILNVNQPSEKGFQVVGFENHPLEASSKDRIEDTACDNGQCTQSASAPWSNTLVYGFGYHCDGNFCADGFSSMLFKRFSNAEGNILPHIIFGSLNKGNFISKLTYKINIPGATNTTLPYQNTTIFVAVPNL